MCVRYHDRCAVESKVFWKGEEWKFKIYILKQNMLNMDIFKIQIN